MNTQEYLERKFDVYEACYVYATEHHNGQDSRSYALLGNLARKGFRPGLSVQRGELSEAAREMYDRLMERGY